MHDRTLITTGIVGGALAAICCATPLLAVVLGAVGFTAWLAKADYIVIPALIICLGLIGVGLYRRRVRQDAVP
jgi:mercuric ion transport protein